MDSGLYIAVFYLTDGFSAEVGRFGVVEFDAGYYFYAGSAKRSRDKRLARHSSHNKPLRWHIDYLSIQAEMLGAILVDDGYTECELANGLSELFDLYVADFGASDCKCGGHLFYTTSF